MSTPARLTVLGCSAGSPSRTGPASGYLLETGTAAILIDCGSGVVAALAALGRVNDLDAVVLTHGHADHCADVVALAYHRAFPAVHSPVPIYGPLGLRPVLDALDDVFGIPTLPTLQRPLDTQLPLCEVLPGSTVRVAGVVMETVAAKHPVPTLSLRFPEVGLVYSSDTGLTDDLIALATDTPVLVAEATYPTEEGHDLEAHGHLTGALVGWLAARSGAQHLIVTHLSDPDDATATLAEVRRQFAGPTTIATPGLVVPLSQHGR